MEQLLEMISAFVLQRRWITYWRSFLSPGIPALSSSQWSSGFHSTSRVHCGYTLSSWKDGFVDAVFPLHGTQQLQWDLNCDFGGCWDPQQRWVSRQCCGVDSLRAAALQSEQAPGSAALAAGTQCHQLTLMWHQTFSLVWQSLNFLINLGQCWSFVG